MNERIREEARKVRARKQELDQVSQSLRDNMLEENTQRANEVRQEHLNLQEKKRLHFLQKLRTFKEIKEDELRRELRLREQHEQKIQELAQKEVMLLYRFNMSEKFKRKCEEEYQSAKEKYHSFYENTILASRRNSLRESKYNTQRPAASDEGKCDIFIS